MTRWINILKIVSLTALMTIIFTACNRGSSTSPETITKQSSTQQNTFDQSKLDHAKFE